jgi:hypothetical protein
MRVRARKRKVAIFAAAACAALFAACTSAYGGAHADVPAPTKSAATEDGAEICR